ncbi:hypothetical protein, partial [Nocardia gipuzkoensis]|uniref:hypothetical protein n=1 Tax=Nocardia gipuzkoensis TaxID=2749991 RepID=UPI001C66A9B1
HLLREVTSVDRCKGCGWEPIANGIVIKASTTDGRTTAGFGGLVDDEGLRHGVVLSEVFSRAVLISSF